MRKPTSDCEFCHVIWELQEVKEQVAVLKEAKRTNGWNVLELGPK